NRVDQTFEALNQAREQALLQARQLTRLCANTIRALHRSEMETARQNLQEAAGIAAGLQRLLQNYPALLYAGYTQDALKEYVEASLTCAIIEDAPLPSPEDLNVEYGAYLNGMAEVTGELRRRCLDILRQGYSEEAERLLGWMDEIYNLLVTVDYPDALTGGLRRQTDLVRGIVERTRADLTLSLREERLQRALERALNRLPEEPLNP
ncbi:MAG: haloacid dehalogenase, partial [Bellilinea sp.]